MGERRREDLEELVFERVAVVHHGEDVVVAELDEDEDDAATHLVVAGGDGLFGERLHVGDLRDDDVDDGLVLRQGEVPLMRRRVNSCHRRTSLSASLQTSKREGMWMAFMGGEEKRDLEEGGQERRGGELVRLEAAERDPGLEAAEDLLLGEAREKMLPPSARRWRRGRGDCPCTGALGWRFPPCRGSWLLAARRRWASGDQGDDIDSLACYSLQRGAC